MGCWSFSLSFGWDREDPYASGRPFGGVELTEVYDSNKLLFEADAPRVSLPFPLVRGTFALFALFAFVESARAK